MEQDAANERTARARQGHVFISHASEDAREANVLVDALEARRIPCWIAPRDIPAGDDYRESILAAIDAAATMVVLLSRHAATSPHVGREVHRAVDRGGALHLVPVRIEVADLGPRLDYDLSVLQWIEAHEGPFEHHLGKIADVVGDGHAQNVASPAAEAPPAPAPPDTSARRLPYWEHRLSPALHFVGRRDALEQLRAFWDAGKGGVLAIEGMGGSGKTSMLEQFLQGLKDGSLSPQDSLFGWSFYESTDSAALIDSLCAYYDVGRSAEQTPQHQLRQLKRMLSAGGRHVLVLDGMERIQQERRPGPRARRAFGEVTDPLVRELLRAIAGGLGSTVALTTSRFPLVDCQPWSTSGGFEEILLDQLSDGDARELLRSHDVCGTDAALRALTTRYGRHALTLTHLAGLVVRFFGGDAAAAPATALPDGEGVDVATRRLDSVLASYQSYLSPAELAVMQASTVFRHAVPVDEVLDLVTRLHADLSDADVRGALDMLTRYHLLTEERDGTLNAHPAVRDYFIKSYEQLGAARSARIAQMEPRLAALTERPGKVVRLGQTMLDAVEEIILQLHDAGRSDEALRVYCERLGGGRVLAGRGEAVRGLRILEAIASDPYAADPDGYFDMRRRVGDLVDPGSRLSGLTANYAQEAQLLVGELRGQTFAAAVMLRGEQPRVHASGIDIAPRFQYQLLRGWSPPESSEVSTVSGFALVDADGNAFHNLDDQDLSAIAVHADRPDLAEQLREMRLAAKAAKKKLYAEMRRWEDFCDDARDMLGPLLPLWGRDSTDLRRRAWSEPGASHAFSICETWLDEVSRLFVARLPHALAAWIGAFDAVSRSEHSWDFWHDYERTQGVSEAWSPSGHGIASRLVTRDMLRQDIDAWLREDVDAWSALAEALRRRDGDIDFDCLPGAPGSFAAQWASVVRRAGLESVHMALNDALNAGAAAERARSVQAASETYLRNHLEARVEKVAEALNWRREVSRNEGSAFGAFGDIDDVICWALMEAEGKRTQRDDPRPALRHAQELMSAHCSAEHQCLVDLVTARVCLDDEHLTEGLQAARSGQRQARDAGYRILEIDLTAEVARAHLLAGDLEAAAAEAGAAIARADDPVCGYVWGSCYASAILAIARRRAGDATAADAVADYHRRSEPLRGNTWFDAALARLGVEELPPGGSTTV